MVAHVSRSRPDGPSLSAVPIVFVIVLLLIGTVATTLAIPGASPTPLPAGSLPVPPDLTAPPTQTPLGRYPTSTESTIVGACVLGIDPNTVPAPIAQAFCVCTLNRYEQLFPTYDEFQRATGSGAVTDALKTDISNGCAQQIVGG
jgi:hypothetical protein